MKKFVVMILVFIMAFASVNAMAMDMGVQIIGGPETGAETVSLDDLPLNAEAEMPGFGKITLTAYDVQDVFYVYGVSSDYGNPTHSGHDAEFIVLRNDILNTQMKEFDFLSDITVSVIYDDMYTFAGWAYQYDWNKSGGRLEHSTGTAIDPAEGFSIQPLYEGHYCFGCTLPNYVLESELPLRMEITIGGNELTYNIRK